MISSIRNRAFARSWKAAGTRSLKTPIRRQRPRRPLGAAPFGRASRAGRSKSTLACPRDSLGSSSPGVAEPRVTGSEKYPPPKKPVRRKSRPTARDELQSDHEVHRGVRRYGGAGLEDEIVRTWRRSRGVPRERSRAHAPPATPISKPARAHRLVFFSLFPNETQAWSPASAKASPRAASACFCAPGVGA